MNIRKEAKEIFSEPFAPGSHSKQSAARGWGGDVFIGKTISGKRTREGWTRAIIVCSPWERTLSSISLREYSWPWKLYLFLVNTIVLAIYALCIRLYRQWRRIHGKYMDLMWLLIITYQPNSQSKFVTAYTYSYKKFINSKNIKNIFLYLFKLARTKCYHSTRAKCKVPLLLGLYEMGFVT